MGQARELMDRITQAALENDLDALRGIYAPDVVATTPDAGTIHGVEGLIEWNRAFTSAFSDLEYHAERLLETGEFAIDQGVLTGTHTRPMQLPDGRSVPPTGRSVSVRSVDIATVGDGKVVRHDFYFDQLDMLVQLGLMEGAATPTA